MKRFGGFFLWVAFFLNQLVFASAILADEPPVDPAVTSAEIPTTAPPTTTVDSSTTPTPEALPTTIPEPTIIVSPTEESPQPTTSLIPTIENTETKAEPSPTIEPTAPPVLEMVSTNQPESTVVIVVNNSAQVNQESRAEANTGSNQTETKSEEKITPTKTVTGDAVALVNLASLANTNNVDSQVKVYLLNNINGEIGQIDLNTAWGLLASGQSNANVLTIDQSGGGNMITLDNFGVVQNQATAIANSGNNQAGGGQNTLQTGNAYALVNIVNLLNTNFIGSKVFLGVLNLSGSSLGDLILPNPTTFFDELNNNRTGEVAGTINNSADIGNDVMTVANSGGNQILSSGNNSIESGESISLTRVMTMANINLINTSQMIINLNTLGMWTGKIYNWEFPGAISNGSTINFFVTEALANGGSGYLNLDINNEAYIRNLVLASANTGKNIIGSDEGDNSIKTGQAWAAANVTNMANLNFINSNWFYGVINVVGDWNGNAIFAYPDLALNVSVSKSRVAVGDDLDVYIDFSNIGYDDNPDPKVSLTLPNGLLYQGDDSGVLPMQSGNSLVWTMSQLRAKASRSFTVRTRLVDENQASGWGLVKPAIAAENLRELVISGFISTTRKEVTIENNSSSAKTFVGDSYSENNNTEITKLWPKLIIEAKNNVNNFIYPGDVVTFEIYGKNSGEATAYRTKMVHKIFNSKNILVSENVINIGDVAVSKDGRVTFGVPINFEIDKNEEFTSETEWIGYTQNNEEVRSNLAKTRIMTRKNQLTNNTLALQKVEAAPNDSKVLGFSTEVCEQALDLLPYILLFIVSAFWLLKQSKRWLEKK